MTGGVVLAATTTTGSEGGAAGEYPPTKLEPDGTWSEAGDSGAFTYSYPITAPVRARQPHPVGRAGV